MRPNDPAIPACVDQAYHKLHAGKVTVSQWRGKDVDALDPDQSNDWWGHVSDKAVKQVCRARYGELWCGVRCHQLFGGDMHCRACGHDTDSWAHVLLGCEHPAVRGAITNRHNAALRALEAGIRAGSLGRWLMLVNAGDADGEGEERTIPDWMGAPPEQGGRLKPDIVIVEGWPATAGTPPRPVTWCMGRRVRLRIVEFTCTTERLIAQRRDEKREKYRPLARELSRLGWGMAPEPVEAVAVGVRGGIPAAMGDTLHRLGIPERVRRGVVRSIQSAVLEGNVAVVRAKRVADGPHSYRSGDAVASGGCREHTV